MKKQLNIVTVDEKDIYPQSYLIDLSNVLECKIEDLIMVVDIEDLEEIWELDELADFIDDFQWKPVKVIQDNYTAFTVGSSEYGMLNDIPMVAEQNACPIGLWMTKESVEKLRNINNK